MSDTYRVPEAGWATSRPSSPDRREVGSRIHTVEGMNCGALMVPGLVMLSLLHQSISSAAFGICFPKFVGMIYEVLSAHVSFTDVTIAYVGAAAAKSVLPGFIVGILADNFEKLRLVPLLVMTRFAFLGGSVGISPGMTLVFLAVALSLIWRVLPTGYNLRT